MNDWKTVFYALLSGTVAGPLLTAVITTVGMLIISDTPVKITNALFGQYLMLLLTGLVFAFFAYVPGCVLYKILKNIVPLDYKWFLYPIIAVVAAVVIMDCYAILQQSVEHLTGQTPAYSLVAALGIAHTTLLWALPNIILAGVMLHRLEQHSVLHSVPS